MINSINNVINKNAFLGFFSLFFLFSFFIAPDSYSQTYEVTYKNNTPQTLTTSVCSVHKPVAKIFKSGEKASEGIRLIAEDGEPSTFISELRNNKAFKKVVLGEFVSNNSEDKLIITRRNAKRLSCVLGMLTATNDGFVAFKNLKLPKEIGQSRNFKAFAYDAGTEVNTESCLHVPGSPCNAHFVGITENSFITRHTGIQGIADLSVSANGWDEPSVRGSVTRIR